MSSDGSILRLAGVKYLKACFKLVFEGEGEGMELKLICTTIHPSYGLKACSSTHYTEGHIYLQLTIIIIILTYIHTSGVFIKSV